MVQPCGDGMITLLRGFGVVAVVLGIMAMAGSGNDCDGRCMEQANTIAEMLVVAGVGLIMTIGGGACIAIAERMKDNG